MDLRDKKQSSCRNSRRLRISRGTCNLCIAFVMLSLATAEASENVKVKRLDEPHIALLSDALDGVAEPTIALITAAGERHQLIIVRAGRRAVIARLPSALKNQPGQLDVKLNADAPNVVVAIPENSPASAIASLRRESPAVGGQATLTVVDEEKTEKILVFYLRGDEPDRPIVQILDESPIPIPTADPPDVFVCIEGETDLTPRFRSSS